MDKEVKKKIRRLNLATHRDVGYFFSSLIIIYCISGLALNHVNDWNADFIIEKKEVQATQLYNNKAEINATVINTIGKLAGEEKYKLYDFPTYDQVKVYYDNASLLWNFKTGKGAYEKLSRRPMIFQSNLIHRNSLKGWKYVADIFSVMLILISVTGLFILKGKHGIWGRGKWLIAAGFLLPIAAVIIYDIL